MIHVRQYIITLRHDSGTIRIQTAASSKEQAVKQVCDAERAPYTAVINVKTIKP